MSEITEQEAREAVERISKAIDDDASGVADGDTAMQIYGTSDMELAVERGKADLKTVVQFARQELARRDAERAEREKPITPEWCLANGARLSAEWYWFDEGVQVRPIAGGKWLVIVFGRMLGWSAECVGQVEELRRALRGGGT